MTDPTDRWLTTLEGEVAYAAFAAACRAYRDARAAYEAHVAAYEAACAAYRAACRAWSDEHKGLQPLSHPRSILINDELD